MPPICARCHLIVIVPKCCQCELYNYCMSDHMSPFPLFHWISLENQICAAVDWPNHADFCVQASKLLHWKEPLCSLWCAFDAFVADSIGMVCHTYNVLSSLSNTLFFKLKPLSSWLLSEPISRVPDTNYHPFIEPRHSEGADGSLTWKVTNIKKVVGPCMFITKAIETGSEKVGHGLLLKWMPSGEAIIYCVANQGSEQKLNIT